MYFVFAVTVPALTTPSAPIIQELPLLRGTIYRMEVEFPAGCAGLVSVSLWREGRQLWPSNSEAGLVSDGYVIGWDEDYDISDRPLSVVIHATNMDDSYPHTVQVRIGIDTRRPAAGAATTTQSAISRALAAITGAVRGTPGTKPTES